MRVLVTGVNGLLGKDIASCFLSKGIWDVYGIGRSECKNKNINYKKLDICDLSEVKRFIDNIKPDLLIHCAAVAKPDICEVNKEYAYEVNVKVSHYLEESTDNYVYISSDGVFNGEKGNYTEDDEVSSVNYYGYTKSKGEPNPEKHLIIRSSIYGYNTNGLQSVAQWGIEQLLLHHQIFGFNDVIFNPLYTKQLSNILFFLTENKHKGIFHLGCTEPISKYEFFRKIANQLNVSADLVKSISVESKEFIAKRTKNTSLNIKKIKNIYDYENNVDDGIRLMLEDMDLLSH